MSAPRPLVLYGALLALSMGLLSAAYIFFPGLRALLVLEDNLTENLSIGFYGLATVILVVGFARRRRFKGMVVLAVLCVIGALEELSYGQRFLPGLVFPTLPNGMTVDALHDVNRVIYKAFERLGLPPYSGFLLSMVALISLALWVLRHRLDGLGRAALARRTAWPYVLCAAGLAFVALLIDAWGSLPQALTFLEEALEMSAALSLAYGAGVGVFFAREARRGT